MLKFGFRERSRTRGGKRRTVLGNGRDRPGAASEPPEPVSQVEEEAAETLEGGKDKDLKYSTRTCTF